MSGDALKHVGVGSFVSKAIIACPLSVAAWGKSVRSPMDVVVAASLFLSETDLHRLF